MIFGMRAQFVIPVIASILILGTFSTVPLIEDVYADPQDLVCNQLAKKGPLCTNRPEIGEHALVILSNGSFCHGDVVEVGVNHFGTDFAIFSVSHESNACHLNVDQLFSITFVVAGNK